MIDGRTILVGRLLFQDYFSWLCAQCSAVWCNVGVEECRSATGLLLIDGDDAFLDGMTARKDPSIVGSPKNIL